MSSHAVLSFVPFLNFANGAHVQLSHSKFDHAGALVPANASALVTASALIPATSSAPLPVLTVYVVSICDAVSSTMETHVIERHWRLDIMTAKPGTPYQSSVIFLTRLYKYLADAKNAVAGKSYYPVPLTATVIGKDVRYIDRQITNIIRFKSTNMRHPPRRKSPHS